MAPMVLVSNREENRMRKNLSEIFFLDEPCMGDCGKKCRFCSKLTVLMKFIYLSKLHI